MADDIRSERAKWSALSYVQMFIFGLLIVGIVVGLPLLAFSMDEPDREQINRDRIVHCFEMGGDAHVKESRHGYLIYKGCTISSLPTTTVAGSAG